MEPKKRILKRSTSRLKRSIVKLKAHNYCAWNQMKQLTNLLLSTSISASVFSFSFLFSASKICTKDLTTVICYWKMMLHIICSLATNTCTSEKKSRGGRTMKRSLVKHIFRLTKAKWLITLCNKSYTTNSQGANMHSPGNYIKFVGHEIFTWSVVFIWGIEA